MNIAAPLPVPDGPPEPHESQAPGPEDGGAFAEILAALGALPPPPTPGLQDEARTAAAEGTTAGSDSPGSTETPTPLAVSPLAPPAEGAVGGDEVVVPVVPEGHASATAPVPAEPEAPVPSQTAIEPAALPVLPEAAPALPGSEPAPTVPAVATHEVPLQAPAVQAPAVEVPAAPAPAPEASLPEATSAPASNEREVVVEPAPESDQGGVSQDDSEIVVALGPRASTHTGHDSQPTTPAHDRALGGVDEGGVFDRRGQGHLRDDARSGSRSQTYSPIGIDVSGPRFEVPSAASTTGSHALPVSARLNELVETTRATVRFAVRHGHTDARITLRPAELGEVRIALRYQNGGVSALLTADSSKSFEALAQAASDLRRSLEQSGVTVQSLEVRLGGDEARRDPNGWQGGAQFAATPLDAQLDDDEPDDEAIDYSRPAAASGGVDVFA